MHRGNLKTRLQGKQSNSRDLDNMIVKRCCLCYSKICMKTVIRLVRSPTLSRKIRMGDLTQSLQKNTGMDSCSGKGPSLLICFMGS